MHNSMLYVSYELCPYFMLTNLFNLRFTKTNIYYLILLEVELYILQSTYKGVFNLNIVFVKTSYDI